MALSIPKFIKNAFAVYGIKNNIPDASNNVTGRAGYDQGFPAINMQPIEAGGIPPDGGDMNGVLYDLSSAIQYIQAGKYLPYNQDFANAIGGYPLGSVVSDPTDGRIIWVNVLQNNLSFPANWSQSSLYQATETINGTAKIATQDAVVAGVNDLDYVTPKKLRFGFDVLLSQNGYFFFPAWMGGIGIQWGMGSGSENADLAIDFTKPFNTTCLSVVATCDYTQNSGVVNYVSVIPINRFSFIARSSGTASTRWIAIGV